MLDFSDRLVSLRQHMEREGLDGYLVPRADEFLGEYVPPSAERLAFLTGFTGSSGLALVLHDRAVVFSNGIYTLQLRAQVDSRLYLTADSSAPGLIGWLKDQGLSRLDIGFDPALFSAAEIARWREPLKSLSVTLKPLKDNLIDRLWGEDRPPVPASMVEAFLETYAGTSAAQKRRIVGDAIRDAGASAAFLPKSEDIAWLLNIRGRDVPFTPVALSWGILHEDGAVDWVIDPPRVPAEIQRQLGPSVRLVHPNQTEALLDSLKGRTGGRGVLVDPRTTPERLRLALDHRGIAITEGRNPCWLPRACKTEAEQSAMREAHRKDAVALVRFLAWLDGEVGNVPLDELSISKRLLAFRREDPAFRDLSFDTIAAFGPNGAIVHYRPTPATNRMIEPDGLLLLDSGAQYTCGTTDITRTIAIGRPDEAVRSHYTAVLKAHIAIATARFPKGTTGVQIDALARAPLWAKGLDYAHGTGHGVGCYLSVHEDAAMLAPRGTDALMPGMILSNEPGYYREGAYGIRLENLQLVRPAAPFNEDTALYYDFDPLTLVPFDPHLTRLALLTDAEKDWLSAYHTRIIDEIAPLLDVPTRRWLEAIVRFFC